MPCTRLHGKGRVCGGGDRRETAVQENEESDVVAYFLTVERVADNQGHPAQIAIEISLGMDNLLNLLNRSSIKRCSRRT